MHKILFTTFVSVLFYSSLFSLSPVPGQPPSKWNTRKNAFLTEIDAEIKKLYEKKIVKIRNRKELFIEIKQDLINYFEKKQAFLKKFGCPLPLSVDTHGIGQLSYYEVKVKKHLDEKYASIIKAYLKSKKQS